MGLDAKRMGGDGVGEDGRDPWIVNQPKTGTGFLKTYPIPQPTLPTNTLYFRRQSVAMVT